MAASALARVLRSGVCVALCLTTLSCGGGGKAGLAPGGGGTAPPSGSNVVSVTVDGGPTDNSVNTLYTSVTVCVPGSTANCQTIDHIQVDTQSFGLRILAGAMNLTLPVQMAANGNSLLECTAFADGYSWGPVVLADVQISGESAGSVPMQVIGDPRFTAVPADCSGTGTEEDTVATFGANGILGIGVFAQDCGPLCTTTAEPAYYYSCTSTQCQATAVPALASQVTNPVSLFATDSNGSIIELPSVDSQGAVTLTGSLIFGIDTQSNNASGAETVLTVDPDYGFLTAQFNGQSLSQSFIDSGSNGTYFEDADLPQCSATGLSDFYCPASQQSLTVTLEGANGISTAVNFNVGNAQTLEANNPSFAAFPTLAGSNPLPESFDFGLPFYYGRRVATALEGQTTSVGTGPYIAF